MDDKSVKNGITYRDFFEDGGVQALAFKDKIGDKTVGVVAPGTHDFGIFDGNTETIVVTSGVLIINGKRLEVGDKYIINKGDHIIFEATDYVSYLCIKT